MTSSSSEKSISDFHTSLTQWNRGYRSNKYLEAVRPHTHQKQSWFLSMEELEVMYGGAAGGGKSDALLMAALQYVDIPGYAAIIFRRTFADLALPGALMDRANSWLSKTDAQKHDGGKSWTFPGGGSITFAYLATEEDKYRYQGAEFQFVAFDELSQFTESQYAYLFSRLRRPSDLSDFLALAQVPLRMRSASNPGGKYGEWVKKSFVTKRYIHSTEDHQFSRVWAKTGPCVVCQGLGKIDIRGIPANCNSCSGSGTSKRFFIPARLEDNPSVDQQAYERSLAMLPAQERAQLRRGRWDIVAEGNLFKAGWIKNYSWRGGSEHIELHKPQGKILISKEHWKPFLTADTANKTKTANDPTVICAWADCSPNFDLCLLEVIRERIAGPFILDRIQSMYTKWGAHFVIVEEASSGITIIQEIQMTDRGGGMTVIPYSPHGADKVERSFDARIRMQAGQIFFPITDDDTITDCQNEMLLFPDSEHDDFVDNLSMATWYEAGHHRDKRNGSTRPASQIRSGMSFPKFVQY